VPSRRICLPLILSARTIVDFPLIQASNSPPGEKSKLATGEKPSFSIWDCFVPVGTSQIVNSASTSRPTVATFLPSGEIANQPAPSRLVLLLLPSGKSLSPAERSQA